MIHSSEKDDTKNKVVLKYQDKQEVIKWLRKANRDLQKNGKIGNVIMTFKKIRHEDIIRDKETAISEKEAR